MKIRMSRVVRRPRTRGLIDWLDGGEVSSGCCRGDDRPGAAAAGEGAVGSFHVGGGEVVEAFSGLARSRPAGPGDVRVR